MKKGWHSVYLNDDVFEKLYKMAGYRSVYDYMQEVLVNHVAAQHRMHLTAFGAFCGGVGLGGLFTLIFVLAQIGGR